MTAPNTPPGPGQSPVSGAEAAAPGPDGGGTPLGPQAEAAGPQAAAARPQADTPQESAPALGGYGLQEPADGLPADKEKRARRLAAEIRIGLPVAVGGVLLGLLVGLLWAWLAPKVPLYADSKAVYLKDPEGEQRAGADGVFVLLGLGAGVLTAVVAFALTRRRGGGVAVAVALAAGAVLGSLIAWRLGIALGPTSDIVAQARQVGAGKVFEAPLDLGAKGALLIWPIAAMVVLLALTAFFGRREEQPMPYWQGIPMPPRNPRERG